MLFQLGNIIFDKAFAPDSISRGDETAYAEHALISQKPRLQPTGNNLEEIELPIKLRAEISDVTNTILTLKKSKDNFEVLPLLMGNGRYVGDFVIIKIDELQTVTLPDGTLIEAGINISLKEFVIPDKLQQQQNAARKMAFAAGEKKPVRQLVLQKNTMPQETIKQLGEAYSNNVVADAAIRQYPNNPSNQNILAQKIEASLTHINDHLVNAGSVLSVLQIPGNKAAILTKIIDVQTAITQFTFPITDLAGLNTNNLNLQDKIKQLKIEAATLVNLIITRAA